ncbi:MAG: tungstate ABC transporter substrate-binding protein WtpA [Candidatus Altiarchaeales archaeon HGW-Altiarchaeales-3]|nr:MAG: tungstate ABC transporter substrate-binding protein WtpA [Candidatus Altiarchaeales archaeon HGW-Altiarchaeales-3]
MAKGKESNNKGKNFKNISKILIIFVILGFVFFSGCINEQEQKENLNLKVLHAGSLTKPLEEVETQFELKYNFVDVQREAAGSVKTVRKITELNKDADVLVSADFSLIPAMMYSDYANFTIKFARNQIVLAYTEKSKYADEINAENWYEILRRDDVKFGFSNPNDDPCGYRSIMVMQLAEFKYNDSSIFDDLVLTNTKIKMNFNNNSYTAVVPNSEDIAPNTDQVMIRSMEVELISALESRNIDYYFIYGSVAVQHGHEFVELPPEINLGSEEYAETYRRVSVNLSSGSVSTGKPIIYGITIPKTVQHKSEAISFVKTVIGEEGQKIFGDMGQQPIVPAIVDNIENMPPELRDLVVEN